MGRNMPVTIEGEATRESAMGGGYEAAERLGRELNSFRPRVLSADSALSEFDKQLMDARGNDILRNVGPMQGASYIYRDSIVGSHFRLNAHPVVSVLGMDDMWLDEFQQEVEAKFSLWAESDENWCDSTRSMNFTGLIRLGLCVAFAGGEYLGTAEWAEDGRPYRTCIQTVDCDRLSNPLGAMDTRFLRRGIERNRRGVAIAAHIREAHQSDAFDSERTYRWRRVPFRKPWGRLQVIHLMEQSRADMTRGIAPMAAALKETHMGRKFHEITLQNAIVNASYAAAIESELPSQMAFASIGAEEGPDAMVAAQMAMLGAIAEYAKGGRNLQIDGVKIPHLYPGSKLKMMPAGTVGGVGQSFEESLNRWISRSLGISYEEYTNDYSKTNYSSSKASANVTRRRMGAHKAAFADRLANTIYTLWLEEAIMDGTIDSAKPLLAKDPDFFYKPLMKEAISKASWIGASVGQVDEMKETQAAVMRIVNGLSTLEIECAKLGSDYRDVIKQQSREVKQRRAAGLPDFPGNATKPGTMNTQRGEKQSETDEEAAYRMGFIDCDGFDANGNRPFAKPDDDDGLD